MGVDVRAESRLRAFCPGNEGSIILANYYSNPAPDYTVVVSVLPAHEYGVPNEVRCHSGSCHGGRRRLEEGDHLGPSNPMSVAGQNDGNLKNIYG